MSLKLTLLLKKNEFVLITQSIQRILNQFDNIESETDTFRISYVDQALENVPLQAEYLEYAEASLDIYENSINKAFKFYELLSDMKKDVYLNTLALIFHHWDKTFRNWLLKELRYYNLGKSFKDDLWASSLLQLIDFCELFGWQIKTTAYFKKILILQKIVNVYKHGNGRSLNQLKKENPQYLDQNFKEDFDSPYIDYRHLKVDLEQIKDFSSAISYFWKDIPSQLKRIFLDTETPSLSKKKK